MEEEFNPDNLNLEDAVQYWKKLATSRLQTIIDYHDKLMVGYSREGGLRVALEKIRDNAYYWEREALKNVAQIALNDSQEAP